MMGKFSDTSGVLAPSVVGCRENYRFAAIYFGSWGNRRHQVEYSHQIERRGHVGEHPAHPFHSWVTSFPEIADGFHPAEDCLHPFSQALPGGTPRMAGGAAVNGRLSALAVLGHMGQGIQGPQSLDESPGIIGLVAAHGNAVPAGNAIQPRPLAASRSAAPVAAVRRGEITKSWQFSISTCPMKQSLASLPLPLQKSRALGSMVEACV
jgi:hypothetical protein